MKMRLRVLVYMNPVVVDKISKRFLYQKDSGFLFTKSLINSLPNDWRFLVLVPKKFNSSFFPTNHIVQCIEYDYCTSIHQNRYHFNRNIISKALPYSTDVDVIISNQPEISANLKVFFQNQRRENPIIINYFHWIDCKESSDFAHGLTGYIYREIDGVLSSNLSCFHNEYAKSLYDNSVNEITGKESSYKYGFFHPKATKFGEDPITLPDKKIILFNHRLNNTTGWQEVVDACTELAKERDDFVLWLTDDQSLKNKPMLEEKKFIINKRLVFNQYGYLIMKSHFSVCNTKGYATWNMSILDSILNGCLPIVPDNKLYRYMLSDTGVYFNPKDLKLCIRKHLDMSVQDNRNELKKIRMAENEIDIVKFIYDEISDRIKDRNITKYDDVVKYIKQKIVAEKSEFVNEFWSFHANSNFQIIRWMLLADGFIDDTQKVKSTYHYNDKADWERQFNDDRTKQLRLDGSDVFE